MNPLANRLADIAKHNFSAGIGSAMVELSNGGRLIAIIHVDLTKDYDRGRMITSFHYREPRERHNRRVDIYEAEELLRKFSYPKEAIG